MLKYTFVWSNSHQLFYMTGNIDSYRRYPEVPFNHARLGFQISEESLMRCYLGTEDIESYVEEGKLFLDKERAFAYLNAAKEQCARHRAFFKEFAALNVSRVSDAVFLDYWRRLIDHNAHSLAYFRSTQDEPSRAIVRSVLDAVEPAYAPDLLLSPELDELNREEVAWEKLLSAGFTRERALEHISKFP